jgi:hypothetical protein
MTKNKTSQTTDYSDYVDHPRYGQGPRYTGLNPDSDSLYVRFHWNTSELESCLAPIDFTQTNWWDALRFKSVFVPFTAVEADVKKQSRRQFQVTHYFDIDCVCSDCGKRFLFFAEEQKYWYEGLSLPLEAAATRCVFCRKTQQALARTRRRYEELFHAATKTPMELLEVAECCVDLIQASVFKPSKCQDVRALLNRLPDDMRSNERYLNICAEVREIEAEFRSHG